ncbi:MAG: carboxypeptidase M32 [Eubacterium sp.]|nr:carboxypeptidase M32 [Eubacterium sp.]
MTIENAKEKLYAVQKKLAAYEHAIGLLQYDGATTAPSATAQNRGASLSILSEEVYVLSTSDETVEMLEFLDENKSSLSDKEKRMVYLMLKDIKNMKKIPMKEYVDYQELLVIADDVWHKAKLASDFEMFRPYLEKIFETNKRFAAYIEPEKDPYDHCLGEYEEGLTKETLDEFFGELKKHIVPLLKKISAKEQVDDSIRFGKFTDAQQEKFSYWLMELIGLDLEHVGLSTTEHPFTTSLGSHFDERITTHYHEDDFVSSMYSVVHEGGHALYDTGSADDLAYTVLDGGTSMSIHESQSRFYENIIGRSRAFCEYVFPKLNEFFPGAFEGKTVEDFYKAVNKAEPSLIRTEADELTYSLHVMVRYELEKRVMAGELEVKDLPEEWNKLYKEYLGVDVPDDKHGVLQDSHWAGGLVGYFPSYALGNAYGAHFLTKMRKDVDFEKCIREGNYEPINNWNRENIWKHGQLYTPAEILSRVLGEPFSTKHYIKYLSDKYTEIYNL